MDERGVLFVFFLVVLVSCFANSPTTCMFLFLTHLQEWVCNTPQTLNPFSSTSMIKHG